MIEAAMQAAWVKFDIDDESTYPPIESGSGIRSIRVITNGGDICQFIDTSKQWVYLLNYEIAPVTHWARLPVYKKEKLIRIHQCLIDSYKAGQAWQFSLPHTGGEYMDCKINGAWIEPSWDDSNTYRLHPHNELIQAYNNGTKIQAYICDEHIEQWEDVTDPCWYEDIEYRIKPATKTVYEWMSKQHLDGAWVTTSLLMSEEEAKRHFIGYEYHKTGRSWGVEV
jgi:hypothetical protein